MATNHNPKSVSITVGGRPLHIHPGNVDLDAAPPPFPVTAPVFINGELVFSRRVRRAMARMLARTPPIDRTSHSHRVHRRADHFTNDTHFRRRWTKTLARRLSSQRDALVK